MFNNFLYSKPALICEITPLHFNFVRRIRLSITLKTINKGWFFFCQINHIAFTPSVTLRFQNFTQISKFDEEKSRLWDPSTIDRLRIKGRRVFNLESRGIELRIFDPVLINSNSYCLSPSSFFDWNFYQWLAFSSYVESFTRELTIYGYKCVVLNCLFWLTLSLVCL